MVNINGRELKRPAVVCDNDEYVVFKIGEYDEILEYYKFVRREYAKLDHKIINKSFEKLGLPSLDKPMERSIEIIELPANQELVENVIYNTGYLKGYIGENLGSNVIKINFEIIE